MIDVYASTEWKRIKLETVGKELSSSTITSWQDIYKYYEESFSEADNDALFSSELEAIASKEITNSEE